MRDEPGRLLVGANQNTSIRNSAVWSIGGILYSHQIWYRRGNTHVTDWSGVGDAGDALDDIRSGIQGDGADGFAALRNGSIAHYLYECRQQPILFRCEVPATTTA